MIKSIKLTKEDILAMQLAEHVLANLFVDGKLPAKNNPIVKTESWIGGWCQYSVFTKYFKAIKVEMSLHDLQCRYNYHGQQPVN